MNSRERVLLLIVLGLAVLVGAGSLLPLYFKNLRSARDRVEKARNDNATKEAQIARETAEIKRIQQISPRLKDWKKISLPESALNEKTKAPRDPKAHIDRLQIEYTHFLNEQLRRSGFLGDKTTITAGKFDDRQTPQYMKNKPIYGVIPFTIEGQASMQGVIKLLEGLHKTPLLHQVKSFSLRRPRTLTRGQRQDDLDVKLTIEVVQMVGADRREALLPEFKDKQTPPVVLASIGRRYEDMTGKNLFGLNPPPPPPPDPVRPTEPTTPTETTKPKEKLEDVLAFVRLTGVDYSEGLTAYDDNGEASIRPPSWEATLWNQNRLPYVDEAGRKKFDTTTFQMNAKGRMKAGWGEDVPSFTIKDKYGNEQIKGQVLKIEARALLLLIERKFYRLKLGYTLNDAMKTPLEEKEVKELGFELPKEPEKSPEKDKPEEKPQEKGTDAKQPSEKKPEEKKPEEKK